MDAGLESRLLTIDQARNWTQEVPSLLRREFERQPDATDQIDIGPIKNGNPFRAIGIGVGAILAVSTFAKWMPRKFKWLSASGAITTSAVGFYCGREADRHLAAVRHAIPTLKRAVIAYSHKLETDDDLKEKLATYLTRNITAQDVSFRPLEYAVIGKAIEFGRVNGIFDFLTTSTGTLCAPRHAPDQTLGRGV